MDILPYDWSRVRLRPDDVDDQSDEVDIELDDLHSDYINANFVDGFQKENAFIASQGQSLCEGTNQLSLNFC